jgi:hypothetical protein
MCPNHNEVGAVIPVIPAVLVQEAGDHKLEASLGYVVRTCFKKSNNKNQLTDIQKGLWMSLSIRVLDLLCVRL